MGRNEVSKARNEKMTKSTKNRGSNVNGDLPHCCDFAENGIRWIQCVGCTLWFHPKCISMTDDEWKVYDEMEENAVSRDSLWRCDECRTKEKGSVEESIAMKTKSNV